MKTEKNMQIAEVTHFSAIETIPRSENFKRIKQNPKCKQYAQFRLF